MASKALTVNIRIEGGRQLLAAFRRLPKQASSELRDRTLKLSQALARKVEAAARSEGGQAALMAPTVKPLRDRVPALVAGGSKRVGRPRAPAWKLLFASEFGMNRRSGWYAAPRYDGSDGRQYKPHAGRGSYWFFKTVEENESDISRAWLQVADAIARSFTRGGV